MPPQRIPQSIVMLNAGLSASALLAAGTAVFLTGAYPGGAWRPPGEWPPLVFVLLGLSVILGLPPIVMPRRYRTQLRVSN